MKYAIYQLKNGEKQREIRFLNLKNLLKIKRAPEYSDYICVYSGILNKGTKKEGLSGLLDELYETFHIRRPKDFEGHSLAVSDIIVIESELSAMKAEAYYVDSFGFKECSDFAIDHMLNRRGCNSHERLSNL